MAIILVVEDDVFVRQFAELTLGEHGHETLSASDVEEAFAHLRSGQDIDALFTDIRLKTAHAGGYEVAREARALRPHMCVLYASGQPPNIEASSLFVTGAAFLEKPYDPADLASALDRLLSAPR